MNHRNRRLDLLRRNHAGAMRLLNGNTVNYGVIRQDSNNLVYFNGRALREIWSPNLTTEEKVKAEELKRLDEKQLIHLGYIDITPLMQIERVIF